MKKLVLIALITSLLVGCNSRKKEFEALQTRYDSLLSIGFTKDTALLGYLESFNAIQANLDSIKMTEMIITQAAVNGGELQPDVKEQINRDINLIYDKLQQNKKTIAELRSKLRKSDARVSSLEQMIDRMTRQMEEKDTEIAGLRNQLENMNIQIEVLSSSVRSLAAEGESKSQTISRQTEELNTAYYVIGTRKELVSQNIITLEGGFAGIGERRFQPRALYAHRHHQTQYCICDEEKGRNNHHPSREVVRDFWRKNR